MQAINKGKTLDSNDQNQVADQRFSLKQWFAGCAQSRGLRKPGGGHYYLRFFSIKNSSEAQVVFLVC